MTLLEGLDAFIGLLTIYLILSLIVSAAGEAVSSAFRLKSPCGQKTHTPRDINIIAPTVRVIIP